MAGGLKEVKNARDVDGIYTGLLRNGLKHGSGVLITQKGDRYEGEFKDGLKHGYGILHSAIGECYKGNFKDGQFHGYGRFEYPDGDVYEGNWSNFIKFGKGQTEHHTTDSGQMTMGRGRSCMLMETWRRESGIYLAAYLALAMTLSKSDYKVMQHDDL